MPETVAAIVKGGVFWAGQVLIVVVLSGLFLRRRYRACPSFVLYLLVTLIGDLLLILGPRHLNPESSLFGLLGAKGFYSRDFWMLKELTLNLLKFAVALELAFRTFRSFPGARSTARSVMFLLVAVTLVSVVAVAAQVSAINLEDRVNQIIGRLQPRVLNGTVWLFTGMAVLILWYRLPVDTFHKAILTGFVPYLLIFTIGLNALDSYGWNIRDLINYVHTTAYLLLLAYWAWAAWAPLAVPAVARGPAPVLERQTS